jgi:hypothetical protein
MKKREELKSEFFLKFLWSSSSSKSMVHKNWYIFETIRPKKE